MQGLIKSGPKGPLPLPKTPTTWPRVMVAVPSTEYWKADFGMCLSMMVAYAAHRGVPLALKNRRGSLITNLREEMVQFALEQNIEYVLFVDSDMTFPYNTLTKLLGYGTDVVGCCCVTRSKPAFFTAYKSPGVQLDVRENLRKLERVWRVGTGVLLVKTTVFKKIPEPWFEQTWLPDKRIWQGEDWGFCDKLEAAGVPILVDTELSRLIGHTGSYTFDMTDVGDPPNVEQIKETGELYEGIRPGPGQSEKNQSVQPNGRGCQTEGEQVSG